MQLGIHFGLVGLVLNDASFYDITMALGLLINATLRIINVTFAAAFLIQSFHTDNFSGQQLANI